MALDPRTTRILSVIVAIITILGMLALLVVPLFA
jgi:hypothetical protein